MLAGLLLSVSGLTYASEESELFLAKGEVAYHTGRPEEARQLFEQAVAADPEDADARYALGLVLADLRRWDEAAAAFERALTLRPDFERARRGLDLMRKGKGATAPPTFGVGDEEVEPLKDEIERAAAERRPETRKRWEIHGSTGVQYDSNVELGPRVNVSDPRRKATDGERSDVAFTFTAGGHYDVVSRHDALVRFEYDLDQTRHVDIEDFDFLSHRIGATASYALHPKVWIGMQAGWNHYSLGRDSSYLSEPFGMPFVSIVGDWGLTQITYRRSDTTYFNQPFDDLRDGSTNTIGASQTFYGNGGRYLTLGYAWGQENPNREGRVEDPRKPFEPVCPKDLAGFRCVLVGDDYEFFYHEAYVAIGLPAWRKIAVDLMYLYRYDEYTEPNSETEFRRRRHDNEHHLYAQVKRPINAHLSVLVAYFATIQTSNITLFDYRRSVVSGAVQFSY